MAGGDALFGAYNLGGVDPSLIEDARRIARAAGISSIGISAGRYDHRQMTTSGHPSRHVTGHALDFSTLNGLPVTSGRGKALAEKFVQAAMADRYTRNHESGNPRAVLFGFDDPKRGGNHLNHIHLSYRPDLDPQYGKGRAAPISLKDSDAQAGGSSMVPNVLAGAGGGGASLVAGDDIMSILANRRGARNPLALPTSLFPQDAPGVPGEADYSPDDPRLQDPALLAAAGRLGGPLRVSDIDLSTALDTKAAQSRIDPAVAMRILQAQAATSPEVRALMQRMGALPVPQQEPTELPAAPTRKTEAIPIRGTAPKNREARLLMALGSLVAPEAAGRFGAAEISGEQAAGERRYEDALTKYKMATAADDKAFEDAQNERNLFLRTQQRNQEAAFQNALQRYQAQYGDLERQLGLQEQAAQLPGLQQLQEQEKAGSVLEAQAGSLREAMKARETAAKRRTDLEKAGLTGEVGLLKSLLTQQGGITKANIAGENMMKGIAARGAESRKTEGVKQTGRVAIQNLKGTQQMAAIDKRYGLMRGLHELDNSVKLRVANIVHGGGGRNSILHASAVKLTAADRAYLDAQKTRFDIMKRHDKAVQDAGGKLPAAQDNQDGMLYEAAARRETQLRQARDKAQADFERAEAEARSQSGGSVSGTDRGSKPKAKPTKKADPLGIR